ncbi:lytic transglycosylase domain-containing protein [Lysobacter terrae]
MTARLVGPVLALLLAAPLCASAAEASVEAKTEALAPAGTRNGREIYRNFREGLADPTCQADASARWTAHFAHAPRQLARNDDVLPLFGYVVDAVRAADLPTEFALIPFVESGYKPGARSAQGPAGLWQMIAITARNHKVPMRAGYDGRLSPIDSTTAAVRYLKTLYGMFAGDWRLAVMAYNAGEYRVLGALKRTGQTARNARPEALTGLSPITHAYVRKLHALSCLLEQADDREEWLRDLDRPVPVLTAVTVSDNVDIATWARRNGQDPAQLQRLNPAFASGRIARKDGKPARLLANASTTASDPAASDPSDMTSATTNQIAPSTATPATEPAPEASVGSVGMVTAPEPKASPARRHTVVRGDSPSKIAKRYGVRVAELMNRNGLAANAVLKPGKILLIDTELPLGELPQTSAGPP